MKGVDSYVETVLPWPKMEPEEERVCELCRFWERDPDPWASVGYGRCSCPKFAYEGFEGTEPADGLIYWDPGSYGAAVCTGPRFGCIHWKAKETPTL